MLRSEKLFRLPGPDGELSLSVRRQQSDGLPVLYVHGATFPSALSVAYRCRGRSWMDDLQAHGFDAWAFDFAGYGGSDRYAAMNAPPQGAPLGRAPAAARQIADIVEHICGATGRPRLAIIAHSWGSMPAALYATQRPERLAALCLFGPIVHRDMPNIFPAESVPAWRLVTLADQRDSFYEDLPAGHPPVLFEPELEQWGAAYLDTDPESRSHAPHAVKVPAGPFADTAAAWSGHLAYKPEDIRSPTLVVRGEWDSNSNDADADWLLARVPYPVREDAKIAKGTHRMHLERGREGLFAAVNAFLSKAG